MKQLKILHLSDLHYSAQNKKEISYIRDAILEDIDKKIIEDNIPNFIIFSGDLVYKPDADNSSINIMKEAYEFFIRPILDKLKLTNSHIFITPGNHDINREVLTRKDKSGLLSYLESKKIVNELIDEVIASKTELTHLNQFNAFINSLNNTNEVYSNEIFKAYIIEIDTIKIGIVNLNSAILSFNNESYGKLIIGEEQLKKAYSYIKDCDIKIANVHHSINWLIWFEQQLVKKNYYKNFNLVFIGHEHMEQPELVNFNDDDTLIVNSASIFQDRHNINGYSLLNYSFESKSMDIYVREYDDREYKFSSTSFQEVENKYTYQFNILNKSKNKKNLELILDEIRLPLKTYIQKELLVNTIKNEDNTIEEIFVEPNIYDKSEFLDKEQDQDKVLYSVNKIINYDSPILIKGIESSGKTTLLNYIANEYLKIKSKEIKIPVILNYIDIGGQLNDTILMAKSIDYFRKFDVKISYKEVDTLIKDGDLVFLIDNYIPDENMKEILLHERFKNNKFIFTAKEEIFNAIESISSDENKNSESLYLELFVYNLKREKARTFFSLYFKNDELMSDAFEGVYKFISKLNIPLTIFNYTLIAHVYENQKNNFKPVNEAYLLNIFMEYLLEKFDISKNIHIGSLGYNLKSNYLMYLAKWMVENNSFVIDRYKLIEITSKFIAELKREKEGINIESFILYMENKGILTAIENDKYRFRYRAFLEFFIAKGMQKDINLKNRVISKNTYLNYKNEIRYYSGLHGEDEELINFFNNEITNNQSIFEDYSNIRTEEIYIPELATDKSDNICVEQISHEKKDKLLESKSTNIKKHNCTKVINYDKDNSSEKNLFQTNILLANIIRNSEQLMNPTLKTETVNLVIDNLVQFIKMSLSKNKTLKDSFIKELELEESLDKPTTTDVNEFISILNIVISQIFMNVIQLNLSSDSFFTIFDELLTETDDKVKKLLIISTFISNNDYKGIDLIDKTINDVDFSKDKFIMMSSYNFFYE